MHLEHYEPQSSWTSSIWMFVAGTAVGAAAALMMAPATGRESREFIRKQSRKVAGDFGMQKDKVASAMRWGQERASSAVRGTVDQAKAAFNKAKSFRSGEGPHESVSQSQPAGMSGNERPTPARPMTSSPS